MSAATVIGRVLVEGPDVEAEVLRLSAPLSFWGGVDPATGRIVDVRHPEHGVSIAGKILVVRETRGSSSSSSVMLELIHAGQAPAALVLGTVDAILVLGILVGREMGLAYPPAYQVALDAIDRIDGRAAIAADGTIRLGAVAV